MTFQIPSVDSQLTEQTPAGLPRDMYNEIFFTLDRSSQADLDNDLRKLPGFLSPEQWRGWVKNTGFTQFSVKPGIEAARDRYQGFFTAVVCGPGTAP